MAIQASGWAPLTDAVVTHVVVPVVTLLPGLQDPVPTGAVVVYRVVHRIEGGQLAKETHQVTKDSAPGRAGHWHWGQKLWVQGGSAEERPALLGGKGTAFLFPRAL